MSKLTAADFDRIDQLAAMLAVFPKVAEVGRELLATENQMNAMVKRANLAIDDTKKAKDELEQVRLEVVAARSAITSERAAAQSHVADLLKSADARAVSIVKNAESKAEHLMQMAHEEADAARREAATIRSTISDERAELAKLEAKAAKIREQLKKMIGE